MAQRVVESTLGRLLTDADFRCRFYNQPSKTREDESLNLTQRELEALSKLSQTELEAIAQTLPPRIFRDATYAQKP